MPEGQKPIQDDKSKAKMILEADLIALKKGSIEREKRLKEELATIKEELAQSKAELKITQTDVEDEEEVKTVKKYLLEQEKKIRAEKTKLEEDLTSFKERERGVRASELATKYGIDRETILAEEDIETTSLNLYAERLAKENEELKTKTSESIYESGTPGIVKKGVWDKTDEEFQADVAKQRREALTRK